MLNDHRTRIWQIMDHPEYTIERTPGAWVVWGPCDDLDADCPICGGCGDKILDACGINGDLGPVDPDMISRATGLESWRPIRIM